MNMDSSARLTQKGGTGSIMDLERTGLNTHPVIGLGIITLHLAKEKSDGTWNRQEEKD